MRDKARRWIGAEGEGEYAECDRRREMRGEIVPSTRAEEEMHEVAVVEQERGFAEFGRKIREEYWTFEEGWTNLNHGQF